MAMTAREAAWTALQRWRKNGAWSDAALHAVLQNAQLEPRDAALAARICYGTLQNLTLLDHYLSIYCTTPLQKLECSTCCGCRLIRSCCWIKSRRAPP